MVVLWLIELFLFASIVVVIIVLVQRLVASNRARVRANDFAQELMRFEEAKSIILQHANRQVRRGVPYEQALLLVLSDKYWPEAESDSEITRD
jgi:Flp pilus assembly protein TadB